jgi:hypothetical protein
LAYYVTATITAIKSLVVQAAAGTTDSSMDRQIEAKSIGLNQGILTEG